MKLAEEERTAPANRHDNSGSEAYAEHVNREWVCLLDLLGLNVDALHSSSTFWSDALDLGRRALRV